MSTLAWILIALPIALAVYAYVVYPLLLAIIARRHHDDTSQPHSSSMPLVTIVVPAYNEEVQIRGAIESLLAQDYPAERRQILILSDASTDGTDAIVQEYASRGVELLRMPQRIGKTAAENASIPYIKGEIVVNSDASVRLHPGAVRHLVAAMSDFSVGVASSRDASVSVAGGRGNAAEAGYVGYEMRLRDLETRSGGIVGASGSGYAIRTALHRSPVREDLSRDFSAVLTAQRNGYRAVSVNAAVCYVPRTASPQREYRRKVRTISRGMETLYHNRDLLTFTHDGSFAWKLVSHKLCRWAVPVATLPAAAGLALMSRHQMWPRVVLLAALMATVLAIAAIRWPESRPLPKLLRGRTLGAVSANLAVVHATWRFFHGHEDHIWEPTRRGTPLKPTEPS